jgi:hypothetical protein
LRRDNGIGLGKALKIVNKKSVPYKRSTNQNMNSKLVKSVSFQISLSPPGPEGPGGNPHRKEADNRSPFARLHERFKF